MFRRRFIQLAVLLLGTSGVRAKAQGRQKLVKIEKYRPCNGSCCHASPLVKIMWDGKQDCQYHNHDLKFDIGGCDLMADEKKLTTLPLKLLPRFTVACLGYPHLYGPYGSLGEVNEEICCYRNIA